MPSILTKIIPCIWFSDQAEEAVDFYVRTFPAGRKLAVSHCARRHGRGRNRQRRALRARGSSEHPTGEHPTGEQVDGGITVIEQRPKAKYTNRSMPSGDETPSH